MKNAYKMRPDMLRRATSAWKRLGLAVIRCAAACIVGFGVAHGSLYAADMPEWRTHLSPRLLRIWTASQPLAATAVSPVTETSTPVFVTGRFDAQGRLQIDVAYDCAASPPGGELQKLGMVESTTLDLPPACMIEGWAATGSLPSLASVVGVTKIDLPSYARHQGAIVNRRTAR